MALDRPVESDDAQAPGAGAVEASITHVGAPGLWAAGFTGQGAVVAGADTGVQWDHPALQAHYRGWNGATADHDYNWHDAIHDAAAASCGVDSPRPLRRRRPRHPHRGDDGGRRRRPATRSAWRRGRSGSPAATWTRATARRPRYTECFQWFIAPTDLPDQNPDPSRAPDVINNSWSCPPSEGCTDPDVLQTVVENTRAAGIVVVVSAGNSGSNCSTVNAPAAIYDASFTVGATNNSDVIASFSSRGPVTVDGSNRLKPDLVAPGSSIRSSIPPSGYGLKSGTSMSGPHVAGLVALVLSAAPCLAGDVDALEAYLIATAVPLTSGQGCGGSGPADVPNPTYGWGAIRAVLPNICTPIFSDGFESGDTSAWSATVP